MKQLPGLAPAWLICLAMILGTTIVAFIPVAVSGGEPVKANDWIGFAGSVVGGTMTIIAALMAWFAVQRQIEAQERANKAANDLADASRQQLQQEAKFAAIVVLTQPVHAATAVSMVNSMLLRLMDVPKADWPNAIGIPNQINHNFAGLEVAFLQLKQALQFFGVSEAWRDLELSDKSIYLTITSALQTLLNIYEQPVPGFDREKSVRDRDHALRNLRTYIRAFDDDLAAAFEKDCGL